MFQNKKKKLLLKEYSCIFTLIFFATSVAFAVADKYMFHRLCLLTASTDPIRCLL